MSEGIRCQPAPPHPSHKPGLCDICLKRRSTGFIEVVCGDTVIFRIYACPRCGEKQGPPQKVQEEEA